MATGDFYVSSSSSPEDAADDTMDERSKANEGQVQAADPACATFNVSSIAAEMDEGRLAYANERESVKSAILSINRIAPSIDHSPINHRIQPFGFLQCQQWPRLNLNRRILHN